MSFSLTSNQWRTQALVITVPRETLSACAHICAHWHWMSQLSTPNLNTQAFFFQGHHLFASLTCISLIQSLQPLVPSYKTESPRSRPNSKLLFKPRACAGDTSFSLPYFFLGLHPLPSPHSSLPCPPLHSLVIVSSSLHLPLPSPHCFLSSSFSPLLSPSSLSSLYISHPSTQHNFPSTVDSLILLPIDPF